MFASYPGTKTYFSHLDISPNSSHLLSHGKKIVLAIAEGAQDISQLTVTLAPLQTLHAYQLRVDPGNFKVPKHLRPIYSPSIPFLHWISFKFTFNLLIRDNQFFVIQIFLLSISTNPVKPEPQNNCQKLMYQIWCTCYRVNIYTCAISLLYAIRRTGDCNVWNCIYLCILILHAKDNPISM